MAYINFNHIEKEFLQIEPLDKPRILSFYQAHSTYFDNQFPQTAEEQNKFLWMIFEIGASFSFDRQLTKAISILRRTLDLIGSDVEPIRKKIYNEAIYTLAYSYFEAKQYSLAKSYFIEYLKTANDNSVYARDYLLICRNKIRKKLCGNFGIAGAIILIIQYSIKFGFADYYSFLIRYFGFIGDALLIIYVMGTIIINTSDNKKLHIYDRDNSTNAKQED